MRKFNGSFRRSRSVNFVHDNLGVTIKFYDPQKWQVRHREKRAEIYRRKNYQVSLEIPDWVEFEATAEPDYYNDFSYLGEFTDKWEPGVIFNSRSGREYKYFNPEYTFDEEFKDYQHQGYSKQVAYEKTWARLFRDRDRAREYISYVVSVALKVGGKMLDNAVLGGVELDEGGKIPPDAVQDLQAELIYQYRWLIYPQYGYA